MSDRRNRTLPREGQIVTFYSFKGGTGRTMALANVAWILAANGMRVLAADWDLESPGLHRFFQPFLEAEVYSRPGIADLINGYAWAAQEAEERSEAARDANTAMIDEHIDRVKGYVARLNWEFPESGMLHYLSPGRQSRVYQKTVNALDWDHFYANLYGGQFFDALRAHLKSNYDYALIDSRTGLSDIADICTLDLPDMVVDCFTLATQGIAGAVTIARMIHDHTCRGIAILPVPMRIDHTQQESVDAGLALAASLFAGLAPDKSEEQWRDFWTSVEVPYRPAYAYEEMLATFGDVAVASSQDGLLPAYERITAEITAGVVSRLPPREEWLRMRVRQRFSRPPAARPTGR